MKISVIISSNIPRQSNFWLMTTASLSNQSLPSSEYEIITWDTPVTNEQLYICAGEILLFIEEPMDLPHTYLEDLLSLFDSTSIAAVQSRIVDIVEKKKSVPFPSRAGFVRLLRVPILDGRICAVRKETLLAVGGFNKASGTLVWADLSWRLLFFPRLLIATEKTTAIALNPIQRGLLAHFKSGCDASNFCYRWRHVLKTRIKRMLIRFRRKVLLNYKYVVNTYSKRALYDTLSTLSSSTLSLLGFVLCLPFAPLLTTPLLLKRTGHGRLYPWTFYFRDDFGTYASRISIADHHFLSSHETKMLEMLILSSQSESCVLEDKTLLSGDVDTLSIITSLTKKDILIKRDAA